MIIPVFWVCITRFGCRLVVFCRLMYLVVQLFLIGGVCNLFSEEMQKLFDDEQKESVIIMLKKKMSTEDIMEILKVTKEYVYQVAKENALQVNDLESAGGDI